MADLEKGFIFFVFQIRLSKLVDRENKQQKNSLPEGNRSYILVDAVAGHTSNFLLEALLNNK